MDSSLNNSNNVLGDGSSTPSLSLMKTLKQKSTDKESPTTPMSLNETQKLYTDKSFFNNNSAIDYILNNEKSMIGSIIQAGNPWRNVYDSLYTQFMEIVQNGDFMEACADLSRICSDTLQLIQSLKSKNIIDLPEEKTLEDERNTWRLLCILYQDRLNSLTLEDISFYDGLSEKLLIENLFKRDRLVRESQLIIDWLERNAFERDDPILHRSEWPYNWENTIHQLLAPESIAIESSSDIIETFHPDAPAFENLPLHHLDVANEKQLIKRIFIEIRCGKLKEAQKLLSQCGFHWKATLYEGWKLFHNPNEHEKNIEDYLPNKENDGNEITKFSETFINIEGNPNRDLWKAIALKQCFEGNHNIYESASLGAFCGHLKSMLKVCNGWEDNLWAYMRTLVDIRVETEIREHIRRKKYMPLPEAYWEQKMSINDVFKVLETSTDSIVQDESNDPFHIIQKYIMLEDINKLLSYFDEWIKDPNITTHFLRFLSHLILFFGQAGEILNHKTSERVLELYILRLCDMKETALVAFYIGKISKNRQVGLYAKYLENITDNNERQAALRYGDDNGLDVYSITKTIVENIRSTQFTVKQITAKVTPEDEIKISAIDWLLFYEVQRVEALIQTNALIFSFLTVGKLEGANLALKKIPIDSVSKIVREELNAETNQIIHEHLCYKGYMDAQESFTDWFKEYESKPQPPQTQSTNVQFTEKVAYQHRLSQYQAEIDRWHLVTDKLAKTAKSMLYNVLLFPNGWLTNTKDAKHLRTVCIPEIVLLLFKVLYDMEMHKEAVQLADIIASERYEIYKVYSKQKLAEILENICESSLKLLNAKKDPWGNSPTA